MLVCVLGGGDSAQLHVCCLLKNGRWAMHNLRRRLVTLQLSPRAERTPVGLLKLLGIANAIEGAPKRRAAPRRACDALSISLGTINKWY